MTAPADLFTTALQATKARTVAGLLALPPRLQRRLAGAPIVRDGLTLDVETQLLLRAQELSRDKGPEQFPVPVGRQVLDAQTAMVGGDLPIGSWRNHTIAGVKVRTYVPQALLGTDSRPTLLFFHGGGFIYGGLDSHDGPCRLLAEAGGLQVISVDYRLAPESPYPAAVEDCGRVLTAVSADPTAYDVAGLGVGGDSAGGNLAAVAAVEAAEQGIALQGQLLIYPVVDSVHESASRKLFGAGFYLSSEFIDLAVASYLPDPTRRSEPQASPLLAETLPVGLAPAHVVTAGFDPLRDEGEAYADKLRAAGVPVTAQRYDGLIHGFFNWTGIGRTARAAATETAVAFGELLRG